MTQKGGTNLTKDVIYIDVEDEITGIIDKVRSSDKKIVALVLPKRAAVLQSVVNMKLLKRAAVDAKKHLVLITAEPGLLPLAGALGVHVAKSLNSRPEIPEAGSRPDESTDSADVEDNQEFHLDGDKTVGELSAAAASSRQASGQSSAPKLPAYSDDTDTLELDDIDTDIPESDSAKSGKSAPSAKAKQGKKFKIPNFNKFRLVLALAGVGVILLGALGYAAVAVWPKAEISIKTDSQAINASAVIALKTGSGVEVDTENNIIPAVMQEVQKTVTEKTPATGEKNIGKKASGEVTIVNCGARPVSIPAGTGVSTSGLTFIMTQSVSLDSGNFTISGTCKSSGSHVGSADMVAQSPGSNYNVNSADFAVAGRNDVKATGSASGGTDEIVKVVTQADIDEAKNKISQQDTSAVQQELAGALNGRGLWAIGATFNQDEPESEVSAEAGDEADEVEVTQTIKYSMIGANQRDIEAIIKARAEEEIDTDNQSITDYGLDEARFSLQSVNQDGADVSVHATVIAGAQLDVDAIKQEVAGKKAGEARDIISEYPGVTNVEVDYSPFWVKSIPKKTDKINVNIEEPQVTREDESST